MSPLTRTCNLPGTPITSGASTSPAAVAEGDLNGDGNADLATANSGDNSVSVYLSNGDGTFNAPTDYPVGGSPSAIAMADLGGNGRPDLIVANSADASISVLRAVGDGTFRRPAVTYPVGAVPRSIAVTDLDGDGLADVAVANSGSNTLSILLGGGAGTLIPLRTVATGSGPVSVASGDFNGDGRQDLAVANEQANTVSIFMAATDPAGGNRSADLRPPVTYPVGSRPQTVAVASLKSDGKPDLVVPDAGSNDVSILLNARDGTGNFQAASRYPVGLLPIGAAAGDFAGHGTSDVLVANSGSNDVSQLIGNGDGTLQPPRSVAAGSGPAAIAIGRFRPGAPPEAAVADRGAGSVSILSEAGATGGLALGCDYELSLPPRAMAFGDLAGNHAIAMAVLDVENTISILPGNADGTFAAPQLVATLGNPGPAPGLAVADFNGDGAQDLAVPVSGYQGINGGGVVVLQGRGDGTYLRGPPVATGNGPSALAVADFDQDGNPDLAVVNIYDRTVSVLLNKGGGTGAFRPAVNYAVGNGPTQVAVGDFRGLGRSDLAVSNFQDHTVSVLMNNGNGTFQPAVNYPAASPAAVVSGDFNSDGRADLAVASGDAGVEVLVNRGDGTFKPAVPYSAGPGAGSLTSADLDGDGKLDLAVGNRSSSTVSVLLGRGDGTFLPSLNYAASTTAGTVTSVSSADLRGNGRADLAVLNNIPLYSSALQFTTSPSNVAVLLNGFPRASPTVTWPRGYGSTVYFSDVTAAQGVTPLTGGLGACEARSPGSGFQGRVDGSGLCSAEAAPLPVTPGSPVRVSINAPSDRVDITSATALARSNLASIAVSVAGQDVVRGEMLESMSTSVCGGRGPLRMAQSSSIASLTVANQQVSTQPVGRRIMFNPTGKNPISVYGNPMWINPTGGRIPMAIVTLNYARTTGDSQIASPVEVEFPPGGALASLIVGKILLAYTVSGCQP